MRTRFPIPDNDIGMPIRMDLAPFHGDFVGVGDGRPA